MARPNALQKVREIEGLVKLQARHRSSDYQSETYENLGALSSYTFVQFCDWLGVVLTPGQRRFAEIAYDGTAGHGDDDGVGARIFGPSASWSGALSWRTIVAVCGARAGKSYVLVGLRLLWGCLTRSLCTLAPGERGVSLVVAPDLRLAKQVIGYARGALNTREDLAALIEGDTEYAITIRRPHDGLVVSLEALPATRGGGAVRGRSLIDAALDECAFFRDEGYAVNDVELYKAVAPRVLPGGQVIIASTPWAETGLLYEMFRGGTTARVLVAHAPTLIMHDSALTREIVAAERERDPDNARREFDAEFMTSGTGQFFDTNAIKGATQSYDLEAITHTPRYRYSCAVDLGFKSDSSALVVVEYDGVNYRVVHVLELRPTPETPLLPSKVMESFAGIARRFGCSHIISDGHYREAIAEHLQTHKLGLQDAPPGINGKVDTYTRARAVLHEGRCVLPEYPRLLSQLRAVVSKPTPGGGLSISSPRRPGGGHGDIASAWVLAIHDLATARVAPEEEVAPKYGSREYEVWAWAKERPKMIASIERRYGKRDTDDW